MGVRKRLFCVLLAILLLVGEVYVGTLSISSEQEAFIKNQNTTKETIVIWYSDEALGDYINSMALKYYENTDVRVETQCVEAENYLETVNNASLVGKGPDLYILSNDKLEMAYLAGLASIVTDPMKVMGTDAYSQTATNAVTYQYKQVAYPLYFETSVLLYNKTHLYTIAESNIESEFFNEDGEELTDEEREALELELLQQMKQTGDESEADLVFGTEEEEVDTSVLDELMASEEMTEIINETSEQIIPTSILDIINFADNYSAPNEVRSIFKWDVNDIFYNYFFVGEYLNLGGDCGDDYDQIDIYNPQTIACLTVYQQLNQFFSIDADEAEYDQILDEFMNGEIIFTIVTTDAIAKLESAIEAGEFNYEYGVATMPSLTNEYGARGLSLTDCVAVNGYSEHKQAANEFAEYLTYVGADNLYARTGKVACRADIEYDNPWMSTVLKEYSRSVSMPKMIRTGNFWIQLETCFSRVWRGDPSNIWLQYLGQQVLGQITGNKVTLERLDDVEVDLGIQSDHDK